MMRKAAISYYPSYVEINAIHAIDPEIKQSQLLRMYTITS